MKRGGVGERVNISIRPEGLGVYPEVIYTYSISQYNIFDQSGRKKVTFLLLKTYMEWGKFPRILPLPSYENPCTPPITDDKTNYFC